MGSFGERLRREREMRGVTLDEISASTKIARRHLEALETENFDSLPGGVFNRGFVRSYARFLGIDEEQAVADYLFASGELTKAEPSFPLELPTAPDPQLNPRRSSLPLILALVALVVVLAIFWARNKRQPEPNENPAASTPAAVRPAETPSPSPAPSTTSAASAAQSPAGSSSTSAASASPSPAGNSSKNPVVEQTAAAQATPVHMFLVKVQAKEDAWITATADGKVIVYAKTLRAGEQQLVRAGKKIVLVTGNAGGLEITFNGKQLGAIGNESERRELTFTAAGLVQ